MKKLLADAFLLVVQMLAELMLTPFPFIVVAILLVLALASRMP